MSAGVLRVAVFGAGRAGGAVARAMSLGGDELQVRLTTRSEKTAREARAEGFEVAVGSVADAVGDAQVVLLAVSDPALEAVVLELAGSQAVRDGVVVAHLSGPNELSLLAPVADAGARIGSLHPLVSMPTRLTPLSGGWAAVDGDGDDTIAALDSLAERMGLRTIRPRGDRARYHAAACLVGNYPQALMEAGIRLLAGCGVSASDARHALGALLEGAARNAARMPPEEALTGPVSRGDVDVVRRHLAAMTDEASVEMLYRAGARIASELVRGRHPAQSEAITRLVSED